MKKKTNRSRKRKSIPDFIMKAAKKDLEDFQTNSYALLRKRMGIEKQLDAL